MRLVRKIQALVIHPRVAVVVLMLAVLASPVASPAVQASTGWPTIIGAQSGDKAIQALAFLPNDLTVDVGDSITWTSAADEIHTLTFLQPGQRPPRFQDAPTTPDNFAYSGTEFVNSGVLTAGQHYTVSFARPGTFAFVCLVHPRMTGTVRAQPAGMPYPHTQRFYDQQGQQQGQQLLVQGEKLRADQMNDAVRGPDKTAVNIGSGTDTTTSGGAQSVGIMRFLPGRLEIKVNDTVVWTTADRFTPHTVTFGKEPDDPTVVVGVSGGRAVISSPGQAVSSGFLRAGLPPPPTEGTQLSVQFTAPGTYAYICALHDMLGMVGTIIVRPAS